MREYRRKKSASITAVRLDLDTEGFVYRKWGGTQRCKRGDWVVNNQGGVYTVDPGGKDGYAMPKEEFHTLYELPEK